MAPAIVPGMEQLRARMRTFIDEVVIPAEPEGDAALERLKAEAKARGLWALGHPEAIGGGGVSLLDFVYLNESIGRSELGQFAVGSVTMQDAIMVQRFGTPEQQERWLAPMVAGELYPSVALTEPEVAGSDPIQVHGALGLTADLPLERMYREARYARIYDAPTRSTATRSRGRSCAIRQSSPVRPASRASTTRRT